MGTQGLMEKSVPPLPKWLFFVKIAIIFLSVIILALAAYAISLYNKYAYIGAGAPGYLIFLCIKTWIIYGISIALELRAPQYYFRIILLIAYCLSCIFWLSGWAWTASWASSILSINGYYGFYYDGWFKTLGQVLAAAAALGALLWILCIVNLVFFVMACMRPTDPAHNVELGNNGYQNQTQTQTVYPKQESYPQPEAVYTQPQQPMHPQPTSVPQ